LIESNGKIFAIFEHVKCCSAATALLQRSYSRVKWRTITSMQKIVHL